MEGEMTEGRCRSVQSLQQLIRMEDGPDESQRFNGREVEGSDREPYVAKSDFCWCGLPTAEQNGSDIPCQFRRVAPGVMDPKAFQRRTWEVKIGDDEGCGEEVEAVPSGGRLEGGVGDGIGD